MQKEDGEKASLTASDLDAARNFASNQEKWNESSTLIIHEVATHGTCSFQQLFRELAEKRHQIADELQHSADGDSNDFGVFRSEEYQCWENFLKGGKGAYKVQGDKVNTVVNAFFELDSLPKNCDKYDFEQGTTTDRDGNPVEIRSLHIQSPYSEDGYEKTNTKLTQILWPNSPEDNYVRLDYDYVNKHTIQRTYGVVDILWQKLSNLELGDDPSQFLKTAGKICYIMAHTMPLKRGTSAVIDWMIRGQAEKHGIILGQYNQDREVLSWPIKALVSADMDLEEYSNWYKDNAFKNMVDKQLAAVDLEKGNKVNGKTAQRKAMLAMTNAYGPGQFKAKSDRKSEQDQGLIRNESKPNTKI